MVIAVPTGIKIWATARVYMEMSFITITITITITKTITVIMNKSVE
jgi:hypothetical protein